MRTAAAPEAFNAAHAAFHAGLVARAPAPLAAEIERLMARGDRYRRMSVFGDDPAGRAEGDREHGAIVAACRAGDRDEAARRLAAHLARSAERLLGERPPAVQAAVALIS